MTTMLCAPLTQNIYIFEYAICCKSHIKYVLNSTIHNMNLYFYISECGGVRERRANKSQTITFSFLIIFIAIAIVRLLMLFRIY
jgi:hypothetical protein